MELPPSGVWRGEIARVSLARQGRSGQRIDGRSSDRKPISAVLFFDEDRVCGHARTDAAMTLGGWWGPARLLRPTVLELAETELWEQGEAALHFTVHEDKSIGFAWLRDGEIRGYLRLDGD